MTNKVGNKSVFSWQEDVVLEQASGSETRQGLLMQLENLDLYAAFLSNMTYDAAHV